MKTPRDGFGATEIGDKIYVAGGFDENNNDLSSAEVYDSKSNKWSHLPDMNEKRDYCAVTSVDGKVYVVGGIVHDADGGWNDTIFASCEMFDPATNEWSTIPDMKIAREGCAACAIGNKLYVIGGSNYDDGCLSSVEVFDTITKKWSSLPNMITKRDGCAAVTVGNNIYVFGGAGNDVHLSKAEVYDATTQEWTELSEMKEKRSSCTATAVGNRIYIVGGYYCFTVYSSCAVFDTFTNTWSYSIPDMKENKRGCEAVTVGPKIYVMGGNDGRFTTSLVEVFDISTYSLYPTDDNYVTMEDGYRSPKSLENLCIDQFCRSLPDLDGDIPPGKPQYIIDAILESLVSHGGLNESILKAFRNYELDQLPLTRCSGKREVKLLSQSETLNERKCKRFKSHV